MESLLALFIQPVVDKFHEFHALEMNFDFSGWMTFGFWYFTFHQIKGEPPLVQDDYSPEHLELFVRKNKEKPEAQGLERLLCLQSTGDGNTYEATCAAFEEHFKLVPPPAALDHIADLYVSTLDRLDLSPAFAALLTNMTQYKPEKDCEPALCFWSQPAVNQRSMDILRLDALRDGFLYNKRNHRGLCHEEYTCFPYSVDPEDGMDSSMQIESMIKAADLRTPLKAQSMHNDSVSAQVLYEFAFGKEFEDKNSGGPEEILSYRNFLIVALALNEINRKYRGLGHIESLRELYGKLLGRLSNAGTFPHQAMNYHCQDYAQLFHSCRMAYQSLFSVRLAIIDGGHRIITALAAIYNVRPTLSLSEPNRSFLLEDTLDLNRVCQNAQFKMAWPNCPLVENKQIYDLMVSPLEIH